MEKIGVKLVVSAPVLERISQVASAVLANILLTFTPSVEFTRFLFTDSAKPGQTQFSERIFQVVSTGVEMNEFGGAFFARKASTLHIETIISRYLSVC